MDYFNQESKRLYYRKLTLEDIPSWTTFFENNPKLKYLGIDLTRDYNVLAGEWIEKQLERYENQGLGHLAVILKSTNEFIGMGGILPRVVDGHDEFEIAYSLKPPYWGKGYATEMAQTMKTYGIGNIKTKRLVSIIDVNNTPSARVATKNGMKVIRSTQYLGMNVDVYGIEIRNNA